MKLLKYSVFIFALALNLAIADEVAKPESEENIPDKAMSMEATKERFTKVCSTCHGPTGRGMASFPRLSDKDKKYLVSRLKQYRAGEKVGPNTPLMAPHAVNLTDAEIDGLADYISTAFSKD